jgi:predicted KAP-like P-loop ATPase
MHLARIIYWYLRRLTTLPKREEALRDAIRSSVGVYSPTHVVMMEEPRESKKVDREKLISEASLPEFRALCVSKIASAAESGALLGHPQMLALLFRWQEWTDGQAARDWANVTIKEATGAVALLRGFIQITKRSGMNSLVTQQIPKVHLKSVEAFLNLDALDEALPAAETQENGARQAIDLFRKALDRRRRGLPDQDGLSAPDDEEDDES